MSDAPLVAIITPVYNGARYLESAMACVQAQTYRPLAHVILDNASTDETPAIIRAGGGDVPIAPYRNEALLPVAANFNAAVSRRPPEAGYFIVLCADDGMTPTAVADMVAIARAAPDVRMVSGIERRNGVTMPSRLPREVSVYAAANLLARIIMDRAHIPYHHVLYRADLAQPGAKFFDEDIVGFDAETVFGLLAGGGQFGFVHEAIFDTAVHEDSLSSTWVHAASADSWEDFARVERFGPAALSAAQFARARRSRRLSLLRKLLWWSATGRAGPAQRDLARLTARGAGPNLWDYAAAVLSWPAHWTALRARDVLAQMAAAPGDRALRVRD